VSVAQFSANEKNKGGKSKKIIPMYKTTG